MIKIISCIIILLLVTSCATALPEQEELVLSETYGTITDTDTDTITVTVTDEIMDEPLLTSEEFLELVAEHWMTLGVTLEDFDDIDIEDFIEWDYLTESVFFDFITGGSGIFIAVFDQYKGMLGEREIWALWEPLYPAELRVAESTNEEFEQFAAQFIEKVNIDTEVMHLGDRFDDLVEIYSFSKEGQEFRFMIGQTMNLKKLENYGLVFSEIKAHSLTVPTGGGEMVVGAVIFISKDNKFFLVYTDILWPYDFEVAQTFLDIDD